MTTIKFSHWYLKMPRGFEHSTLLEVLPVKLEDLSPAFLYYDTTYLDGGEEKQYPLPTKGDYMILLLQAGSGNGQIFTTIRSQVGAYGRPKLAYYKRHIGEMVDCVVTE
jgi:hypothetical protein